jgi:peptide chain release factor 1
MFDRLRQIEERSREVARLLADPHVIGQGAEYRRLAKEHADLAEVVARFEEYRRVMTRVEEARRILSEDPDPELRDLAQSEAEDLGRRRTALEEELRQLLVPRDPQADKSVFVEIRAGAGGDEAGLFVADLARMYTA